MAEHSFARCIAVDARCLQDPDYARRGVGRHTSNLLRHAPRDADRRLIGLIDPQMPTMDRDLRDLFDTVRPNSQFHEFRQAAAFVSPSPMTHDPLFVARLLDDPRLLRATVIYDFIPYEIPERYLSNPELRHAYYTCLRWLSRYDLFLPISQASAAPLRTLLGIAENRIHVAGAALDEVFETLPDATRRGLAKHVLVVGGGDPRKNVECAVRAHAVSRSLQQARTPLVITANYSPERMAEFRDLANALGGAPELVRTPGHVSETELVGLYRDAICVIAPSRAEGFDLPLVEAMAAGVPALASDIPAHRELVENPALRFGPDDHVRLCGIIEPLATDPEQRTGVVAAQATLWPRYRAAAVAERFWQPIEAALAARAAPSVARGARPRIALLSPLPPDRSGCADYTAATCAELGKLTDLHVFSTTLQPAPLPGAATVRPLTSFPNLSTGYDRVINVMGNSHFHLQIYHQMMRYGGACVAHDSRMLSFYRALLGMDRATQLASEELGRPIVEDDIHRWMTDEATLEALHYGEIVAAADPVLVHSPVTKRLMAERYGAAATLLPFCIYRPWTPEQLAQRTAARRRLGLRDDEVVIVTFGFVHKTKAPTECIWALDVLRGWGVNASLHFVGADTDPHSLAETAAELGLSDKVVFVGEFVTDELYRDYLIAADLGVQLRLTYLGSLSGALLDCIAAGLPTVTNESLGEVMDAPGYVRRVPDNLSPLLIAEAFADLLDAGLARARPEADRSRYAEAHSFRVYAERMCQALELEVGA